MRLCRESTARLGCQRGRAFHPCAVCPSLSFYKRNSLIHQPMLAVQLKLRKVPPNIFLVNGSALCHCKEVRNHHQGHDSPLNDAQTFATPQVLITLVIYFRILI